MCKLFVGQLYTIEPSKQYRIDLSSFECIIINFANEIVVSLISFLNCMHVPSPLCIAFVICDFFQSKILPGDFYSLPVDATSLPY